MYSPSNIALGYCPTNRLQMTQVFVYNSPWGYIWNLWILLAFSPVFLKNQFKKLKHVFPRCYIRKILILLVFLPVFLQSVTIKKIRNCGSKTVFVCVLFLKNFKNFKNFKTPPQTLTKLQKLEKTSKTSKPKKHQKPKNCYFKM